jgi:hypothetical protein
MKLTSVFCNFVDVLKKKPKLSYPVGYYSDVSFIVRRFLRVAFGLLMSDLIFFINDTFLV